MDAGLSDEEFVGYVGGAPAAVAATARRRRRASAKRTAREVHGGGSAPRKATQASGARIKRCFVCWRPACRESNR